MSDSRTRLEHARDKLAAAIDTCESMRDLPSLCREYRATLEALDGMKGGTAVDPVDELQRARDARRGAA